MLIVYCKNSDGYYDKVKIQYKLTVNHLRIILGSNMYAYT